MKRRVDAPMTHAAASFSTRQSSQGANCMSIDRLLREGVFDADSVALMTRGYERVREALGLADRDDPATSMVAQTVLSVVASGVRDPERVYQLVLTALRTGRS